MRHNWINDKPRAGWSTCSNCHLEVKTYKIKKGGLSRCDPVNALQPKINCRYHMMGAIAGVRYCWYCGQKYIQAERTAGEILAEKLSEKTEPSVGSENPPPIPL